MMGRRKALILPCAAVVLAALVAGAAGFPRRCGSEAGALEDEFRIGIPAKPRTLDPRLVGGDAPSQHFEELLFLALVTHDRTGNVIPAAAEGFVRRSPIEWVVTIRPGLACANGTPIGVDDVVAYFRSVIAPPSTDNRPPFARAADFGMLRAVERGEGPRDVVFRLKHPDAAFPSRLAVGLLPRPALELMPGTVAGSGYESGPFVLAKETPGNWWLRRNTVFAAMWPPGGDRGRRMGGTPKGLRFTHFDGGQLGSALRKGDIDLAVGAMDPDLLATFRDGPDTHYRVESENANSTMYLGFRLDDPNLSKLDVRRAISLSVDRFAIARDLFRGFGFPARGFFPPSHAYHREWESPEPSNAASEAFLDTAGLEDPDGEGPASRFEVDLHVVDEPGRIRFARALVHALRHVGIGARLKAQERGLFLRDIESGRARLWLGVWSGYKDPDHLRTMFHSGMIPPLGANRGLYRNRRVDALLEEALHSLEGPRKALYDEIQNLLAADMPYVLLWHGTQSVVRKRGIEGFVLAPDGNLASLVNLKRVER